MPGYIYRQVFDGLGVEADWGIDHAQHQDQRDSIIPESAGQPVFRPVGAPFSSGTGQLVTEGVAFASLEEGEFAATEGKKWFRIPNGSWYQTWFPVDKQSKPSLKIFFDRWEERDYACRESIWRGFVPGQVFERQVASGSERKLIRAQTDGAMEIIAGHEKFSEFTGKHGFSSFHRPGFASGEGDLIVYTWSGRDPGRFYLNGSVHEEKPNFLSLAGDKRFVGLINTGNSQTLTVIGTDILREWLQMCEVEFQTAECTMAVFSTSADGIENRIFVYSEPQKSIYCFALGQGKSDVVKLLNVIKLAFTAKAMSADRSGNIYLAALETTPASFDNPEDLVAGYESLQIDGEQALLGDVTLNEEELQKRKAIRHDLSGRFVFSQTGYAALYVIYEGQITPVPVNRVFLDKTFYARAFMLKNVSLKELQISSSELIALAEKPGNSLAEMQGNVPGFPDQYREPKRILIAIP